MGTYGPKRAPFVNLRLKIGRWVLFININLMLIRKGLSLESGQNDLLGPNLAQNGLFGHLNLTISGHHRIQRQILL